MRHHGIGLLLAVMLVVACVNPCVALENAQQPGAELHDHGVIVQGDNGKLYAILSPAANPIPWFDKVKPYDTVRVTREWENGTGADIQIMLPDDTTESPTSWPLPGARAQNPALVGTGGTGAAIVAVYFIPGVGEVALLATGVVLVGGVVYYVATSNDPTCIKIREAFSKNTAQIKQFNQDAYQQRERNIIPFGQLTWATVSWQWDKVEIDYNNAKEKGMPVPGEGRNKDTTGHGMNKRWKTPYSSQRLFRDQTDKDNGCPKQIRYYGKDGKPEVDIDFYGPERETFPHRHGWRHDLIAKGIKDKKLTRPVIELGAKFIEAFKKSKCRNYDFENHRFKKGDL